MRGGLARADSGRSDASTPRGSSRELGADEVALYFDQQDWGEGYIPYLRVWFKLCAVDADDCFERELSTPHGGLSEDNSEVTWTKLSWCAVERTMTLKSHSML